MTAPYTGTGDMAHPDAIAEAARFVSREWGETGYSARIAAGDRLVCVLEVVCNCDGSYFSVVADRCGNTLALPDERAAADEALLAFCRAARTP